MHLFDALKKEYTKEQLTARQAQRMAEFIAWGPMVFQASRLMIKFGILDAIRDSDEGMTRQELVEKVGQSDYTVKCLLEASLCIGLVLVDTETDRFSISKMGWFLLNDQATRVNVDFNHDVCYEGLFSLEESFTNGRPEGLKSLGSWPTIYEGLSSLPADAKKSWFGFDHFYSDSSFADALKIVFGCNKPRLLYDVGGNTGRWALKCVDFDENVRVRIIDLPQQIELMKKEIRGKKGCNRIDGYPLNLLDDSQVLPKDDMVDAIWMSQFLDCFGMDEIESILVRTKEAMTTNTRLYIMETLWDRQRFEPAAFCLTMTSLYFTAMANGNSKMYCTDDIETCIKNAGLKIVEIHDGLGQGHSIIVCQKA